MYLKWSPREVNSSSSIAISSSWYESLSSGWQKTNISTLLNWCTRYKPLIIQIAILLYINIKGNDKFHTCKPAQMFSAPPIALYHGKYHSFFFCILSIQYPIFYVNTSSPHKKITPLSSLFMNRKVREKLYVGNPLTSIKLNLKVEKMFSNLSWLDLISSV